MENQRQFLIVGNWKENHTLAPLIDLILDVINPSEYSPTSLQVVIAPAMIHIAKAKELLRRDIPVAAQTCSPYSFGAYTGEVSSEMLKDLGVRWIIAGHSERRRIFGETNEVTAMKVKRICAVGLHPIICIGELSEDRTQGKSTSVILCQLQALKDAISDWQSVVLCYEPAWAVGTGVSASPAEAQEMHAFIRHWVRDNAGMEAASHIPVIYGGSVSEFNCKELILQPDIDGFMVGGASIQPQFRNILETTSKAYEEKHSSGS